MRSKFKTWILIVVIYAKCMILLFTTVLWLFYVDSGFEGNIIFLNILLTLISLLVIREAKFKWNRVVVTQGYLIVDRFFGLWSKDATWSEVNGFTTAVEQSKTSPGNTLYIYIRGVRQVEISDAYCSNFHEIKRELKKHTDILGFEGFHFSNSIRNMFGRRIMLRQQMLARTDKESAYL